MGYFTRYHLFDLKIELCTSCSVSGIAQESTSGRGSQYNHGDIHNNVKLCGVYPCQNIPEFGKGVSV